jgi:hypothetical protein
MIERELRFPFRGRLIHQIVLDEIMKHDEYVGERHPPACFIPLAGEMLQPKRQQVTNVIFRAAFPERMEPVQIRDSYIVEWSRKRTHPTFRLRKYVDQFRFILV